MLDVQLIKTLHIISATVLFGTGVGSAFYFFVAHRSKNIHSIVFATHYVVIADAYFTTPAVIIQFLTGCYMVYYKGYTFTDMWVVISLILFFIIGALWLPVLRIQIRMRNISAKALDHNSVLNGDYWQDFKKWVTLGSLAFPLVIIIFFLMVFRPL